MIPLFRILYVRHGSYLTQSPDENMFALYLYKWCLGCIGVTHTQYHNTGKVILNHFRSFCSLYLATWKCDVTPTGHTTSNDLFYSN